MSEKQYIEDERGVHVMRPGIGSEYTLCGDAWDGEDIDGDEPFTFSCVLVTCPDCIEIIKFCRHVVFAAPTPTEKNDGR